MKKQKIPKGVLNTLMYTLQILEEDYSCHDADSEEFKKKEREILAEIKRAEKWLSKFEVSK